jgi:hypothetical protein
MRYAILGSLDSKGQALLDEIEGLYTDFGYPQDIGPFIYYTSSDGNKSSAEDLIERYHAFRSAERNRLDFAARIKRTRPIGDS